MDDAFFGKHDKAIADLFEELDGFVLCEFPFGLEELFEVGVTNFLYDVVVVAAFHDIHHLDDIVRLEHLHDLYFREQCILKIVIVIN